MVRTEAKEDYVDPDYLPERYLEQCLERKDNFPKGYVKSYRSRNGESNKGWAVYGKKQVKPSHKYNVIV